MKILIDKETVELAIEALELFCECGTMDRPIERREALRQAIEQAQKQEPVAWATQLGEYAHIQWGAKRPEYPMVYEFPLYTRPQAREPLTDEQERKVARLFSDRVAEMCNVDADDHWKYHFDDVLADVQFVLKAAHGIKGEA